MANEIVTTAQDRMKQSLGSLQRDLGTYPSWSCQRKSS